MSTAYTITERPILFSGAMVRAILANRKTQTRRAITRLRGFKVRKFEPSDTPGYDWHFRCQRGLWQDMRHDDVIARCPYGRVGDRLWVRETFASPSRGIVAYQADGECGAWGDDGAGDRFWVRHGGVVGPGVPMREDSWRGNSYGMGVYGGKWTPSIHMPRWASRITLEITKIRIERLNDITREDAIAEGIYLNDRDWWDSGAGLSGASSPHVAYFDLWASINGAESVADNPWLFVIDFERVR